MPKSNHSSLNTSAYMQIIFQPLLYRPLMTSSYSSKTPKSLLTPAMSLSDRLFVLYWHTICNLTRLSAALHLESRTFEESLREREKQALGNAAFDNEA